jgi:hypothetical protein
MHTAGVLELILFFYVVFIAGSSALRSDQQAGLPGLMGIQ